MAIIRKTLKSTDTGTIVNFNIENFQISLDAGFFVTEQEKTFYTYSGPYRPLVCIAKNQLFE